MDSSRYLLTPTADGSFTLFSKQYDQYYHATKDGALYESIHKHVKPALDFLTHQEEIFILDICFGMGLNTLATLWYNQTVSRKKLRIFTPELDATLLHMLHEVPYPDLLQPYLPILYTLIEKGYYEDTHLSIELYIGDARAYLNRFNAFFDIVYQDAFSPSHNRELWTVEYFAQIKKAMKPNGILTTYSTALPTRLALYENGFHIYLHEGEKFRSSTLATVQETPALKAVNMRHKIACNPHIQPLGD